MLVEDFLKARILNRIDQGNSSLCSIERRNKENDDAQNRAGAVKDIRPSLVK